MFRSFVRMLGLTGETARTSNAARKGFSPRLETLDGRVMPSTLHVAAGIDAVPAAVRSVETPTSPIWVGVGASGGVDSFGGLSGGVIANRGGMASVDAPVEESITRSSGEEIPQ
jgi:hypothetical protein